MIGAAILLIAFGPAPTTGVVPPDAPAYDFRPIQLPPTVTAAPTTVPTPTPTILPTAHPTARPTLRPTIRPAVRPTTPPTTPPTSSLTGRASWFATGTNGMYAAAGPALRTGDWRGRQVRICAKACIVVTLNDWCQCLAGTSKERLIDLSDEAFRALSPLSAGVIWVTESAP